MPAWGSVYLVGGGSLVSLVGVEGTTSGGQGLHRSLINRNRVKVRGSGLG